MDKAKQPEVWLRGTLDNMPALLQPVAHALLQSREEINEMMTGFPEDKIWDKVAGMASVGFHLQHLTGVLDRLLTYARNESLNEDQSSYLSQEGNGDGNVHSMLQAFNMQIDKALTQLSQTNEETLTEKRGVGRMQITSTVIGLLVHAAEHTMRHTGQLLVTINVLSLK